MRYYSCISNFLLFAVPICLLHYSCISGPLIWEIADIIFTFCPSRKRKVNVSSSKSVLPLTYFVVIWDAFKKLVYISTPHPPLANRRKSLKSFQCTAYFRGNPTCRRWSNLGNGTEPAPPSPPSPPHISSLCATSLKLQPTLRHHPPPGSVKNLNPKIFKSGIFWDSQSGVSQKRVPFWLFSCFEFLKIAGFWGKVLRNKVETWPPQTTGNSDRDFFWDSQSYNIL